MKFDDLINQPCSISRSLAVLGDRWTLVVLKQAFAGTRRFEDFLSNLGISRSRLADRLARLVDNGILERVEYFDNRTRHEYRLSEKGIATYPIVMSLRAWGDAYLAPDGPPLVYRHHDCDGAVDVRLACSSCSVELTARDVEVCLGPALSSIG